MLKIFICEDNAQHLASLTELIDSCIDSSNYDISIEMNTQFPDKIIAILPFQKTTGLYFLDINLNCEIDTYKLASIIRKYDPRAFIVIVTCDMDSQSLVYRHAVEAMDYIIKGTHDFNERIKMCINNAYERYVAYTDITKMKIKLMEDTVTNYALLSKGSIVHVAIYDVIYIESFSTKKHYIYFHTQDCKYLARKRLKDVEKILGTSFVRCHRSCLVNMQMISSIDPKKMKIYLSNGKSTDIGRNHLKKLLHESQNSKKR